jgi:hypothetical protein
MELIVKEPAMQSITFNFDELKREIGEALEKYRGLVYTDATIKDAKADRATLNKFKDALETKRKEVKKRLMIPYDDFAGQVKVLTGLIDFPLNEIDKQVKAYEEKKKAERLAALRKFYDYLWNGYDFYQSVLPFEKAILLKKEMLNASTNEKAAEGLLQDVLEKCKSDLNAIAALETGANEPALIDYYKTCFDVNAVIKKAQDIKSAAEAKKLQEEKTPSLSSEIASAAKQSIDGTTHTSEIASESEAIHPPFPEPVIQIDFRVWGTKEQLHALQTYLKENGVKYGAVK